MDLVIFHFFVCHHFHHGLFSKEAIGLEHAEEFINLEKVVRILTDKLQKVVNVGLMKSLITTIHNSFIDYIACLLPKLQDSEKYTSRESAAEKNIV